MSIWAEWIGGQADYVNGCPTADFNLLKFSGQGACGWRKIRDLEPCLSDNPADQDFHGPSVNGQGRRRDRRSMSPGRGRSPLRPARRSARIPGAAAVLIGDRYETRSGSLTPKRFGFEPIDLTRARPPGRTPSPTCSAFPKSIAPSIASGLRGKRPQGADGKVVEAPAVVLNGLMEITRAAGAIGQFPALYVTDDPGAKEQAAKARQSQPAASGLGWAKSHALHHWPDAGAEIQPPTDAGDTVGSIADRRYRQCQGESVLSRRREGYKNFDAGVVANKFVNRSARGNSPRRRKCRNPCVLPNFQALADEPGPANFCSDLEVRVAGNSFGGRLGLALPRRAAARVLLGDSG